MYICSKHNSEYYSLKIKYTIIYIVLSLLTINSWASTNNIVYIDKTYDVDSIIDKIVKIVPTYSEFIKEYHSDYYIKERLNIDKKSIFFRYLPFMFHIKNGERQFISEMNASVHYTYPDIYDQKNKARIGTIPSGSSLKDGLIEFFHVNIYSSSLLYERLVSPLTKEGKKYYYYELDSVGKKDGYLEYKISFKPKLNSDQLVKGSMVISDGNWTIRQFSFAGFSHLVHFKMDIEYGAVGSAAELLPVKYNADIKVSFFGNKVRANYLSCVSYHGITMNGYIRPGRVKSKYDLTESFTLSADTTAYSFDRKKFDGIRPVELDSLDHVIYDQHDSLTREIGTTIKPESKAKIFWGDVGDMILDNYNINFNNAGNIRCSPLLNPFMMSYSKGGGFAYKQDFKYNCLFKGDKLLRIAPSFGYNFKEKKLYWTVYSEYNYYPSKRGSFHIDAGNGNMIYGAELFSDIIGKPGSYPLTSYVFKDYFMELYHSIDIVNGLQLNVGLSAHRRTAKLPKTNIEGAIDPSKDKISFNNWAPRLRLEWTPGQYYFMRGRRKVNYKSYYPTFSVDWERGIKGFLKSSSEYERWEVDMHQTLEFGLMRTLFYRIGTGLYTNNHSLYFIDFLNFTRNNLPEQWNNESSTSFQLLNADYYNDSNKYFQIHATYQSPFILFPRLLKIMRNVLQEKLYFNFLITPKLKPYYEVGYGISTHYFSLRAFAAFKKSKFMEQGVKFTFELFD